jgi:molybdate transport system substrate-binding protein
MSVRLSSYLSIIFLLITLPTLATPQITLTVAAAADLSALEPQLAQHFEKTNPIRVRFVTGASAILSQQIENGAPYDVFLSANAKFLERLSSFGKLRPDSVVGYAVGRIGILWKDGKQHPIRDLTGNWVRFVALPNPKLAPYGVAAQEALEHAGIWKQVQPKVVYGENVRQALQLFESGNADAVLTAAALLHGKNATLIPADWHRPLVQKAGIIAGTKNLEAAREFLDYLNGEDAQAIFAKFGFGPTPTPRPTP